MRRRVEARRLPHLRYPTRVEESARKFARLSVSLPRKTHALQVRLFRQVVSP